MFCGVHKNFVMIFFVTVFSHVALVQPSVASNQDAVMPPVSTIPGSFLPSAIPGAGVFNPVGVKTQQANNDKIPQSAEGMDTAAELTLQGNLAVFVYFIFITIYVWIFFIDCCIGVPIRVKSNKFYFI